MPSRPSGGLLERAGWVVLGAGLAAVAVAATADPGAASAAASQDWPPFVLVTGLLVLGVVAAGDGLFDAAGALLARAPAGGRTLFAGAAVLVAVATAVLNLDTAVVFGTPVLVAAARSRRTDEAPLVYLAVFGANGASLLLPGSNLTNLIVLDRLHQASGTFATDMLPAWVAAVLAVTVVIGVRWHRSLAATGPPVRRRGTTRVGAGVVGVGAALGAMLVLSPGTGALTVLAVAALAAAWSLRRGTVGVPDLRRALGLPVLGGLLCLAVALGTAGRAWAGPAGLLAHASAAQAAVVGALSSVVVNNLPATSLLAARAPAHSHALLVGLDLGPNLAVTGALSAVLWLQVAGALGARPSARRYTRLGLVVVPVSMAAALGALALWH